MAQTLSDLRGAWAAAALRNGTVVGASTGRFVELLGRDALSKRYIQRSFAPTSVWAMPYQFSPDAREKFLEHTRALYDGVARRFGRMPETLHLTNGFWRANHLPLVQPSRMIYRHRHGEERARVGLTRFLALLFDIQEELDLERIFKGVWVLDETGEYELRVLPDSLLIRLLVHACQINTHWQRNQTGGDIALPVLKAQCEAVRTISCEFDRPEWNHDKRDPETGEPTFLIELPDERRRQLERALRATLDSAAHRIDPWITGFAWQRLKQHSASPRHAHRLGAYGWVEGRFAASQGRLTPAATHAFVQPDAGGDHPARQVPFVGARGLANEGGRNPCGR